MEDLRQRRRQLTAAASALYLDINEVKLRLRVQVRMGEAGRGDCYSEVQGGTTTVMLG